MQAPRSRRVLRLGTVLTLTYLPMAVFAVGIAASMPFMIAVLDGHADDVARRVSEPSAMEAVHAYSTFAELPFLLATGVAGLFAALGAAATIWARQHVERRITRIAEYIEGIGSQSASVEPPTVDVPDSLGRLARDMERIAQQVRERDAQLRVEVDRHEFEAQVQSGLAMAESEGAVLDIVRRAFERIGPEHPTQLLLADSSQAHLREAVATAQSPRCSVTSPHDCVAVRQGHAMSFPDSSALDACPKLAARETPAPSGLCVPIGIMGSTVGILHVTGTEDRRLPSTAPELYASLARNVGSRLGMIRALESSQLQAETDPLTGLVNRRSLDNRFGALRQGHPRLALAVCDLDHFKRLNDTHGHETGDRALVVFAQVLRDVLRPDDLPARFGGEEFVVVLPSTMLGDAVSVMERIRTRLREVVESAGLPAFTASFGVAACPEHGRDLRALTDAADRAMYRAKTSGRDRVVTARLSDLDADDEPDDLTAADVSPLQPPAPSTASGLVHLRDAAPPRYQLAKADEK